MLNHADGAFADRLSQAGIAVRTADPNYLEEPRGLFHGTAGFVALPRSTEDVATIVGICGKARVGLVPYGGGSGLVAGQIALTPPATLILSLEKMDAIRAVYPSEDVIVVEAGVTVATVQDAAQEIGRLFPLSYASQDSARIGGGLSVNSGGLNVVRYGMARDACLGIEAVLPNGEILHGLKRLRKDNTGYDLRHLLIGAEGTLGIITAAALKLFPLPHAVATAFLSVPSPDAALSLLGIFRDQVGETVSAFELIPDQAFDFLAETHPDLKQPFSTPPRWSVLAEIGLGAGNDAEALMGRVFEAAVAADLVDDGVIAQSGQQRGEFWSLRETIPEANRRIGSIASHDISVPLSEIGDFIKDASARISAIIPCRINAFGHLGDGNLHFNVFPEKGKTRADYAGKSGEVTRCLHDMVMARGGSFSAEHGIGRAKAEELQRYGDPAKLAAMRAIKTALDPDGIMNPGAVLPEA
ncbi:MAG: FAD-binding oxidoreductase [Silicimonas sp.]|nr:FAD-binding oxidoreductase [Silicimonas sp.]